MVHGIEKNLMNINFTSLNNHTPETIDASSPAATLSPQDAEFLAPVRALDKPSVTKPRFTLPCPRGRITIEKQATIAISPGNMRERGVPMNVWVMIFPPGGGSCCTTTAPEADVALKGCTIYDGRDEQDETYTLTSLPQ